MTSALPGPLRFGAFEFNPANGELRKHGLEVKLTPLSRALLSELIQNPSRVLTRKELQARLWPASEFLDFEHGLNKVVYSLRAAMGDMGRKSRFIETIPRRGYRFIPAWIQTTGRRATDSPNRSGRFSLAVLPIEVVGGGPELTVYARLIVSAFTDALTGLEGLSVIAQGTVRSFNLSGVTPQFAGGAMGVCAVVAGEMILGDSDVYLRMELIDVSDGRQLSAASVRRTNPNPFDAEGVANELLCRFGSVLTKAARGYVMLNPVQKTQDIYASEPKP